MGRPKLLLPWNGSSMLGQVWGLFQKLNPAQSILVLAPDHCFEMELARLGIPAPSQIVNSQSHLGMYSSIRTGLAWPGWNEGITHFLVALGDQPLVSPEDLDALLDASRKDPGHILQPVYQGKRGHPVLLPRAVALALLHQKHFSLKEALADFEPVLRFVKSHGPGTLQDVDTPDDYQKLSPGNSADTNA